MLIDGASFDLRNVLIARSGVGVYGANTFGSGMFINNPPSAGVARLERVSIVQNRTPGLNCSQAVQSTIIVAPDGERFIAYDDKVPQGTADSLPDAAPAPAKVLLIDSMPRSR